MNRPLQPDRRLVDGADRASPECVSQAKAPIPPAENDARMRGANTLGGNYLTALILLGFAVAHVIGITILSRDEGLHQSPNAMVAVHTD